MSSLPAATPTPSSLWSVLGKREATPSERETWLARQATTPYLDALEAYAQEGVIPFHVPGHKHGKGVAPRFRNLVGEQALPP